LSHSKVDVQVDVKLAAVNVGPWHFGCRFKWWAIFNRIAFCEKKYYTGCWKLKFIFCFMETSHEPVHLGDWSFVQWRIMSLPTGFIWIIILFDEALKCGDCATFWGYSRTNAETFRVELCSFVQWNLFVNCVFNLLFCEGCWRISSFHSFLFSLLF
jgi:hypothetical protein